MYDQKYYIYGIVLLSYLKYRAWIVIHIALICMATVVAVSVALVA